MDKDKPPIGVTFLALAVWLVAAAPATVAVAIELQAGAYSFSDELGGFRLISASGTGTTDDPVVIVEEIPSVDLAILVIRRYDVDALGLRPVGNRLTLVKWVVNRSARVWAGFEVELREIVTEPSTRGDGLSFNQAGVQPGDIESNAFTRNDRRFEPADRIVFTGGWVDPGASARFRLTITDPTPVPVFYLLQDPNLLSAERRGASHDLAAAGSGAALKPPRSHTHQ